MHAVTVHVIICRLHGTDILFFISKGKFNFLVYETSYFSDIPVSYLS